MLTAGYGCPPESFDLEYKDKDDNFVRVAGLTPKTFFDQYIAFPFDEYTSVIHSPTDDKPFGRNCGNMPRIASWATSWAATRFPT